MGRLIIVSILILLIFSIYSLNSFVKKLDSYNKDTCYKEYKDFMNSLDNNTFIDYYKRKYDNCLDKR